MKTRDEITRNILTTIRNIQESKEETGSLLKEEKEGKKKQQAIAITDNPRYGQNALSSQIDQFKTSVESGAQFAEPNEENAADSPLIYLPETGNLIFSGTSPCLNNLKWQFVLKTSTGNGCFIWSDGMILSKDNLKILNKLYGFYENWRDQWNAEAADLDKMVKGMMQN
jgi:hypothetical protein